jgi:hypothetical protein
MGATVALPLLDAMTPALAATAKPIPRMAFVYFPHGAVMSEWTPSAEGRNVELGTILEPLTPFRDRLSVVSGLNNRHAQGPVHALTPGTWLSGVSPRAGDDAATGVTADQLAADHLGADVPLSSIEVAGEATTKIGAGPWEGEFSSSYGTTISFRSSLVPLRMESSPRVLFDKLFANAGAAESGPSPLRTSVLDRVAGAAADLQRRLGPADRATLREYLDTVRGVERRVATAEARLRSSVESPIGRAQSFADRMQLLFDMIALAFQADITRVASFMLAAEASDMSYDGVGVSESFHELSHHQNDVVKLEKLVRIQRYHTQALAAFVRRLSDLSDGDGSLLDRSLILYGSNMSNSYTHEHVGLPLAVIGGGCGHLRGGQHVRYADGTPVSNLLLTLLDRAGVPVESVGDSTGECADV